MFIHWYPGHMAKALNTMKEQLKIVDCVVYVLDARAVASSFNPAFAEVIGTRPVLYVINKADTVPGEVATLWQKKFLSEGKFCVTANSAQKTDANRIISELQKLNAPIVQRYAAKGVNKTIRAMVIGIPNCGKSTLINSLIPAKKVVTGNKPGVTRGKQWVKVGENLEVLDTPGTLYPDFSDQEKARTLAFIGSITDRVIDDTELATELVGFLKESHGDSLRRRYGLDDLSLSNYELLGFIAKKKGKLLKGGEPDTEKTAQAVIVDFRKGLIGKIALETV